MTLSEALKHIREKQGLSAAQVRRDTGINVARLEATDMTRVRVTTLEKLCEYYGVRLSEVFKMTEN